MNQIHLRRNDAPGRRESVLVFFSVTLRSDDGDEISAREAVTDEARDIRADRRIVTAIEHDAHVRILEVLGEARYPDFFRIVAPGVAQEAVRSASAAIAEQALDARDGSLVAGAQLSDRPLVVQARLITL